MADEVYVLSQADIQIIQDLLTKVKRTSAGVPGELEANTAPTGGIFLVKPVTAIPARSGDTPGYLSCPLYKMEYATDFTSTVMGIVPVTYPDGTAIEVGVYNIHDSEVSSGVYTRVSQGRHGQWLCDDNGGSNGTSDGPATIRKFTLDGGLVWACDTPGATVYDLGFGNGKLVAVESALEADSNTNQTTNMIRIIDPATGALLKRITTYGGGGGVKQLTVNDTRIVFSSNNNGTIDVFDQNGLVVWMPTSGEVTTTDGTAIKLDSSGDLYLSGDGGTTVVKGFTIGNATSFRTITTTTGNAKDIEFDSGGNAIVVFAISSSTEVRKYDTSNALVWGFEVGADVLSVAVDANDNVLIGGAKISSKTTRLLNSSGAEQWSANHGTTVRGVCFDADGNCYTTGETSLITSYVTTVGTDRSGTVATTRKYSPSGTLLWSFDWGSGTVAATNAIMVRDGFLYVCGNRSTRKVQPVY